MNPTLSVLMDESDVQRFSTYLDAMGKRTAREELVPILLAALEPMVASEKAFLSSHSISGALEESLKARSGSGDRLGTISVFSAPTATTGTLKRTWGGANARRQQRKWLAGMDPNKRGRTAVFYGPIVHQGHNIVRGGKVVGYAEPVPFAAQAVDSMGDAQAEAAAEALLTHIIGEPNG